MFLVAGVFFISPRIIGAEANAFEIDSKDQLGQLSQDVLDRAGLFGESLYLKFDGFNEAWHDFLENGPVPRLKQLLKWINIILGSLASVIPSAEAIKEYKEALEMFMDSTTTA